MSTPTDKIPEWLQRWTVEWVHKMECQGVDPRQRDGFKTEIPWLYAKILDESPAPPTEQKTEEKPKWDDYRQDYSGRNHPDNTKAAAPSTVEPAQEVWTRLVDKWPNLNDERLVFRNRFTKQLCGGWIGGNHETKQLYFLEGKNRQDVDFYNLEWREKKEVEPLDQVAEPFAVEPIAPEEKERAIAFVEWTHTEDMTHQGGGTWYWQHEKYWTEHTTAELFEIFDKPNLHPPHIQQSQK